MKNSVEHTLWYCKWNLAFFTIVLILYSLPCGYFELAGVTTMEARLILGGMFLVILGGWIRAIIHLKKCLQQKTE